MVIETKSKRHTGSQREQEGRNKERDGDKKRQKSKRQRHTERERRKRERLRNRVRETKRQQERGRPRNRNESETGTQRETHRQNPGETQREEMEAEMRVQDALPRERCWGLGWRWTHPQAHLFPSTTSNPRPSPEPIYTMGHIGKGFEDGLPLYLLHSTGRETKGFRFTGQVRGRGRFPGSSSRAACSGVWSGIWG